MQCNLPIYIARLQKFSNALTAENKNVFSFAAKVQTVQFNRDALVTRKQVATF